MRRRWIVGAVMVILFVAGGLAWMVQRPGPVRRTLVRWFGPPPVELSEVHAARAGGETFDHGRFDRLLGEFVDGDGGVDYLGLVGKRDELQVYLQAIAAADFDALDRDEKLALLINAYNASTLELILDHWPVDSIKDIPSDQRWDAERWIVAEQTFSLNQIEHEQIRPSFREPRIHFALVCAAVGCPPLRNEAYTGERLEEQLEAQTRRVHADTRWVRYEAGAGRIELTSLYEWYAGDFEQVAGTVLDYVAGYRDDLAGELDAGRRPEIRFLDYDWSLNGQQGG